MSPHWSIDDTPTSPNGPGAVPDADLSSYERVAILLGQADLGLVRALAELARYDAAGLVELLAEVPTDIVPAQTVVGDVKERATKPSEPAGMSEAERIKAITTRCAGTKTASAFPRSHRVPFSAIDRNRSTVPIGVVEMRIIPLFHGMEALVDDEDYERLRQYRWYASKNGTKWNAKRHAPGTGRRQIYMHRDLLDAPLVDHIDGNGLNNQRSNLRPADKRINTLNGWGAPIEGRNTKGYGGEGRRTGGGNGLTCTERGCSAAAMKYGGGYARLNLIRGEHPSILCGIWMPVAAEPLWCAANR